MALAAHGLLVAVGRRGSGGFSACSGFAFENGELRIASMLQVAIMFEQNSLCVFLARFWSFLLP